MVKNTKNTKQTKSIDRDKAIEEVTEEVKRVQEFDKVRKFIEDNIIEFDYKEKTYRVRRPVPKEREEVNRCRILKHTSYLKKILMEIICICQRLI